MKTNQKYLYWIIISILVIVILLMNTCGRGDTKTTITTKDINIITPEITGNLSGESNLLPSKGKDSIIYYDKIVYVESKVNETLVNQYKKAQGEIERLNIFLENIRERDYVTDYEDENIKIRLETKVEGTLKDNKPSYVIKSQTIPFKETTITKETTLESAFGLFGGVTVQSNKDLSKVTPGVELSAQINSKMILSAGVNSDSDISAGVKFRIFNINK